MNNKTKQHEFSYMNILEQKAKIETKNSEPFLEQTG